LNGDHFCAIFVPHVDVIVLTAADCWWSSLRRTVFGSRSLTVSVIQVRSSHLTQFSDIPVYRHCTKCVHKLYTFHVCVLHLY